MSDALSRSKTTKNVENINVSAGLKNSKMMDGNEESYSDIAVMEGHDKNS